MRLGNQGLFTGEWDARIAENIVHTELLHRLPDTIKRRIKKHMQEKGRPIHLITTDDPEGIANLEPDDFIRQVIENKQATPEEAYDSRLVQNRIETFELNDAPDDVKVRIKELLSKLGRPVHLPTEDDPEGVNALPEDNWLRKWIENKGKGPLQRPKTKRQAVESVPQARDIETGRETGGRMGRARGESDVELARGREEIDQERGRTREVERARGREELDRERARGRARVEEEEEEIPEEDLKAVANPPEEAEEEEAAEEEVAPTPPPVRKRTATRRARR